MGLYKRKRSPHWQYDITVEGRRFRGSTRAEDRGTAELILAALRRDLLVAGATGRKPGMTLKAAGTRYWNDHARRLPSAETMHYMLSNLYDELGRDTRLDRLRNADLATAVARLRGRMGDSSVNRHLTVLRAVINRARRSWDVAVAEIDWRAHRLAEPPPRDRWLTPAQADRLIDAAAPHLRAPIAFTLLTGLRRQNVIGLDWRQVDLGAGVVRLVQKGGRRHLVHLAAAAVAILASLGPQEIGPVFTRTDRLGRTVPVRSVRTGFAAACRRARIPDFRWHDLRHTFGTWAMQAGANLRLVQEAMGHADVATTMRYLHHQPAEQRALAQAVASHWRHTDPTADPQGIENKNKIKKG